MHCYGLTPYHCIKLRRALSVCAAQCIVYICDKLCQKRAQGDIRPPYNQKGAYGLDADAAFGNFCLVFFIEFICEKISMLIIKKEFKDKMIAHSNEEFPNEACGILAGPP